MIDTSIVLRKGELQKVSKKKGALEDTAIIFNLFGNSNWGDFCCFLVLFLPGSLICYKHNFFLQGSLIAYLNIKDLTEIGKTVSIKERPAYQWFFFPFLLLLVVPCRWRHVPSQLKRTWKITKICWHCFKRH